MGTTTSNTNLSNAIGQASTGQAPVDPYQAIWDMRPGFQAAYDPKTMSMSDAYQQMDPLYSSGINKIRDDVMSQGPSGWLRATQMKNALNEKDMRDKGAQDVGGQTGQAMSRLASSGGLSSGARERVAEQGQRNMMDMTQNAARATDSNNLTAGIQDQSNRLQELQQLPGLEQQKMSGWLNAKGQDTTNLMNNTNAQNQFNMDLFKEKSQAYGANQQATATANSAPGGMCFITTAMCDYFGKPDNCRELTLMRKLRDEYALKDPKLTKEVIEYYKLAGVVDSYLRDTIDVLVWENILAYIQSSANFVDRGEYERAYSVYKRLVSYIKDVCAPAFLKKPNCIVRTNEKRIDL